MRTKRVLRYFCDFCKRGSLSKTSMTRHESICWNNPHRDCLECGGRATDVSANSKKLMAAPELKPMDEVGFQTLDTVPASIGCASCTIAAILQGKGTDFIVRELRPRQHYRHHGVSGNLVAYPGDSNE